MNEPTGRVGNRAYWILRDGNIDVSAYTRQLRDQPGTRMVPEYVGITRRRARWVSSHRRVHASWR